MCTRLPFGTKRRGGVSQHGTPVEPTYLRLARAPPRNEQAVAILKGRCLIRRSDRQQRRCRTVLLRATSQELGPTRDAVVATAVQRVELSRKQAAASDAMASVGRTAGCLSFLLASFETFRSTVSFSAGSGLPWQTADPSKRGSACGHTASFWLAICSAPWEHGCSSRSQRDLGSSVWQSERPRN